MEVEPLFAAGSVVDGIVEGREVAPAARQTERLRRRRFFESEMPDVDALFASIDLDGSGSIDFSEFCAAAG